MLNLSNFKAPVLYLTPKCLPLTIRLNKEKKEAFRILL